MHGAWNGFNKENSQSYLHKCWDIVVNIEETVQGDITPMCSPHT